MMKNNLLILFFSFIATFVVAQEQNKPSILWKQLKTDNFKIIFPSEIEKQAQRVANTLEWVYENDNVSLKVNPKPVSMVLYSGSAVSNAYAGLGPRRMGWYLMPSPSVRDLGSIDWLQTLSIHEYRHIRQYAKNKKHFTKFMTYLFGDIGQGMMRWSIPAWYFEGDAVAQETALTKGGRGRIPFFAMTQRAYSLLGEDFTYDQAYLRSYKRFYPSHYNLGYHLISYGRTKYGVDLWDKVIERTNKRSWWPYAFGNSLRKYTGLNAKNFYKDAMNEMNKIWKVQDAKISVTKFQKLNTKKKKNFTYYSNPQFNNLGEIVCKKFSLDKLSAFYVIDANGTEKKIKNTSASEFSFSKDNIAWASTISDIRWGEHSYSDIYILNIKTKKENRLTFKKKYLSPSISPDGQKIVVVEQDSLLNMSLVLLDAKSGMVLQQFNSFHENETIRIPSWSEDGKTIAFTHSNLNGLALSTLNIETGEIKTHIDYCWENIERPVFYKNFLIYNSDYSGIGNIYAIDLNTKQKYSVTSSRFGAYNASISADLGKVVYQEYDKLGYDIALIDLKPEEWTKIEQVKVVDHRYYQTLVEQEGSTPIHEAKIPIKNYPIEKYKNSKDAVNIHSWGVFPTQNSINMALYSSNYLNTVNIAGGYLYDINEKTNGGYLSLSYSKFFPILEMNGSLREYHNVYIVNNDTIGLNWNEFNARAGLRVPLNFSRNLYTTTLSLSAGTEYSYIKNKVYRNIFETRSGGFAPLYFSLSFINSRRTAYRDINTQFAQVLNFDYKKIMPYDSNYEGYLLSARSGLYFPGVLPNNSFRVGAAYEKQLYFDQNNSKRYYFSKETGFARGYESHVLDEFYKFSFDYQLPVWSPDISIGPLVYIKRIKLGGFYDYLEGSLGAGKYNYKSVGASLRFQFNLFRINYPLEFGVQYAYRLLDNDSRISILILGLPI